MKDLNRDYAQCLQAISEAAGIDEETLISRTRRFPVPIYRAMVAESMRDMGYSLIEIGSVLKRDHSTVIYIMRALDDLKGVSGYQSVDMVYKAYKRALKRIQDDADGLATIESKAEEYLGRHCRRDCGSCSIKPEQCRHIQDEGLFLAGAEAQLDIIRRNLARLKRAVARCQLLCGNDEVAIAINALDKVLNKQPDTETVSVISD